jgi:hypothetical protein
MQEVAAVSTIEDDDEESTLAAKAFIVARKAATFGAGYGLGWFVHTRLRKPRPDHVEVEIIQ